MQHPGFCFPHRDDLLGRRGHPGVGILARKSLGHFLSASDPHMSVTLIGKALESKRTAATLDPGFISKPEPSWHDFRGDGLH